MSLSISSTATTFSLTSSPTSSSSSSATISKRRVVSYLLFVITLLVAGFVLVVQMNYSSSFTLFPQSKESSPQHSFTASRVLSQLCSASDDFATEFSAIRILKEMSVTDIEKNIASSSPPSPSPTSLSPSPSPSMQHRFLLYQFSSTSPSLHSATTLFDKLILEVWRLHSLMGSFAVNVEESIRFTRVKGGNMGFIVCHNPGRSLNHKRKPSFEFDNQLVKPFDPDTFNFARLLTTSPNEAMFLTKEVVDDLSTEEGSLSCRSTYNDTEVDGGVFINASPITIGHSLFVPRVTDHLPQVMTQRDLFAGFRLMTQSNHPNFHAGFNSLGAFASVNHLHFQLFFAPGVLAIQNTPRSPVAIFPLSPSVDIVVSVTTIYPLPSLVFEVVSSPSSPSVKLDHLRFLSDCLWHGIDHLQRQNIPHNILISENGRRGFLIPRRPQSVWDKDDMALPGLFEAVGMWVFFERSDFDWIMGARSETGPKTTEGVTKREGEERTEKGIEEQQQQQSPPPLTALKDNSETTKPTGDDLLSDLIRPFALSQEEVQALVKSTETECTKAMQKWSAEH